MLSDAAVQAPNEFDGILRLVEPVERLDGLADRNVNRSALQRHGTARSDRLLTLNAASYERQRPLVKEGQAGANERVRNLHVEVGAVQLWPGMNDYDGAAGGNAANSVD